MGHMTLTMESSCIFNCWQGRLKKLDHSYNYNILFNLEPDNPEKEQIGFGLSLTLHSLRDIRPGQSAIQMFVADLLRIHEAVAPRCVPRQRFTLIPKGSTLKALLLGGSMEPYLSSLIKKTGPRRWLTEMLKRRIVSCLLDSGIACSNKLATPLQTLLRRVLFCVCAVITLVLVRAQRRHKPMQMKTFLSCGSSALQL